MKNVIGTQICLLKRNRKTQENKETHETFLFNLYELIEFILVNISDFDMKTKALVFQVYITEWRLFHLRQMCVV